MQQQLPEPDKASLAHSHKVTAAISQCIKDAGGWISFGDFMQQALYAPGLGYYVAGATKLGADGDFVTAPEISPLFSQSLAQAIEPTLKALNQPRILEFGAGTGIMAADILMHLATLDALPEGYDILEISPELKQRQQQTLKAKVPEFFSRIAWLDQLPDKGFEGIVLANEVLDAMPVERFTLEKETLKQLGVIEKDDAFHWQGKDPESKRLFQKVQHMVASLATPLPEQYCSEMNLYVDPWLQSISDFMQAGLLLCVDYGFPRGEYYHPQRNQGTIMCHFRQHAHPDPLILPGIQDITAHVDFTEVAEGAIASGFSLAGYATQAHYLMNAGITELLSQQNQDFNASQQAKRLLMPGEMGELFKVMALTKGLEGPILGFQQHDHRAKL